MAECQSVVPSLVRSASALPAESPVNVTPDAVVYAVGRDKKRVGAKVPFVLVEAPGDVLTGQTVADFRPQLGRKPNVDVCVDVKSDRVLELYLERVARR